MLTIDASQLKRIERVTRHIQNGVPRVIAPAINRALASGQTAVRRTIRKVYTIKQKDIPTVVYRARYSSLEGNLRIRQGMLGVDKFFYKPLFPNPVGSGKRRKQLFVRIKKGSGGFIKRGFPTNTKGGPFQRRSSAPRLPIRKLLAIGAPIMASQSNVGPIVIETMEQTLAKRIDHEVQRVLASAGEKT